MRIRLYQLIFFIGILLASCGEHQEADKIRIGFSQCISNHPWRDAMNHSMQLESSLHPNVELTIYEANTNAQKQINDIEQMIADRVDAIIISPLEPNTIVPVIEKAYFQGIPVVLIDRKINSLNYTAYIGADNIEIGRNAGKYIASDIRNDIRVIEVMGGDNSSPVMERSIGFHQIVDKIEGIRVISRIKGDNDGVPYDLFAKVLDSLKGEPIDYAFVFSDEMARQAISIAKEKGREKEIKFIGVDGLNGRDGGIQMVKDGDLEATILYPTGGNEVIKLTLDILQGEQVAKNNVLATTVIDSFNADIMKTQFDKINEHQNQIEAQVAAIFDLEEQYAAQSSLLKIALGLLTVILTLTGYSIFSIITIRKKNKQLQLNNDKITVQRNQIEKIANEVKLSNEAKLNFFTGLSHEFKTPLTLIMSATESISDLGTDKESKLRNEVELIYNNSNRLLRLMNNLLDFRKIEDKKFNLRASKTNILRFSEKIGNDFMREAKKRNIDLTISSNNAELELFIDRNLMDKVYFNLLSNAFKFTPDNGKISVAIVDSENSSTAEIHFKDSGIGIPKNEIKDVFNPFFKGSNNRKNSSGIGLHLSKQFIDLHLGKIEVMSVHGTEFVIRLFKGDKHFNEDQIITEPEVLHTQILDFVPEEAAVEDYFTEGDPTDTERYTILIIEDNRDLSYFLKGKLALEFDVLLSDGSDAMEKAFEHIPDIILCDINLPHRSGFEICEQLKTDLRTSHIPTIILTAMSNKESYIKGLQSGADLFLTKPFSYSILMQSIKSLLYNREKLRFYYTNNIYKIEHSENFESMEQKFLAKLNVTIRKNLGNSNFSVEHLAEELNISRVQLYRKIKAMMGLNVSDYIINFRLDKARAMLENTGLSISEIAFDSGFSSSSYFSKSFKNKYGVSPVAYRKSN